MSRIAARRRFSARGGLLACSVALACATAGGPPATPDLVSPGEARWVRHVDAFPVLDETGRPYAIPFLGGFNVPRPQLVDIDGDGDQDLFIQERTDELLFFERTGDGGSSGSGGDGPRELPYTFRPGRFDHLRVGEWYRFVDVDSDGDPDLLAEEPFSYLRLYRNDGSAGTPRFTLAADTIRDEAGRAIFSDRQNIPNAADIDCDGRLDLFIGRLIGTVARYEATGEIRTDVAPFRHITDRFEDIEIVAEFGAPGTGPGRTPRTPVPPGRTDVGAAGAPTLHGANTMALADIDSDGDTDLFWGDFFEAGLLFIENIGTCGTPNLRSEPRPFPLHDPVLTSGYNAPTFGDVDGDGDLDLVLGVLGGAYNANQTTADNLLYLEQRDGRFERVTSRFLSQIDVGSESHPVTIDWDGDGDLDLLVANKIDPNDLTTSRIYRFENTGTPERPELRLRGHLEIDGAYHNAPAFGDLDADGDLDLILGVWRKELAFFRNEGTAASPRFVLADSAVVELTRGSNATPALVDIDADGDLDLFVGESSGTLNHFRNDGSPAEPRFVPVSDEYLGIDVGRRSVPRFIDADGDGDFDLVIGSESDGLVYYRNDGSPDSPSFVASGSPYPGGLPALAVPEFADLDGDGDLDLLLGGAGGGLWYFESSSARPGGG